MEYTNIKIHASQSKTIYNYKSLKLKVLNCNANIYFNKQCLNNNFIPTYAKINIKNNSKAATITKEKAQKIRLKEEIKFLYKKKEHLNGTLYKSNLEAAHEWGNIWPLIQEHLNYRINIIMDKKYKTLNNKIKNLDKQQASQQTHQHNVKFHPRIVNLTNIPFTIEENKLLNKGLKYNLHHKKNNWIQQLALEADTAITYLPYFEQEYIRNLTAYNIDRLYKKYQDKDYNQNNHLKEYRTLNNIKKKLQKGKATLLKADKGNTIVIWYREDYNNKIQEFIHNNNFITLPKDPTNRFQKEIRKIVNHCHNTIRKDDKWKYINLNPTAPTLKGLPKIHKTNMPIRPIVNWTNAPGHKLGKLINKLIQTHVQLPYAFNVNNTIELIRELEHIPINHSTKLASFDITNMYANIPILDTLNILKLLCTQNNIDKHISNEIITLTHTITNQNYFKFNNTYFAQTDGLAMGAPTSPTLSEIYLQYMENIHLYKILNKNNIIGYFRYVDDILIIYNQDLTDIDQVLDEFNYTLPTLKFTMENECNNAINFLDINIHKGIDKFNFNIYRKPTTTDTIIPQDSCHPLQHKYATINYFINRMNNYHLNTQRKEQEINTVKQILVNNNFNNIKFNSMINKQHKNCNKTEPNNKPDHNKHKWVTFTYIGKETYTITKLFNKLPINIAYKTNNTIGKLLNDTESRKTEEKLDSSGIYRLSCPDCNMKYIGQTGRSFKVRFKEHFHDFKYNHSKSKYATHLLENHHSIGTIEDTLEVLHTTHKGRNMNTIEQFYIHIETIKGTQINDKSTTKPNKIFDIIIKNMKK